MPALQRKNRYSKKAFWKGSLLILIYWNWLKKRYFIRGKAAGTAIIQDI